MQQVSCFLRKLKFDPTDFKILMFLFREFRIQENLEKEKTAPNTTVDGVAREEKSIAVLLALSCSARNASSRIYLIHT